ncbi:MAG: hypothetical protein ACLFN3_11485, partial [Halochromatium sp.]
QGNLEADRQEACRQEGVAAQVDIETRVRRGAFGISDALGSKPVAKGLRYMHSRAGRLPPPAFV